MKYPVAAMAGMLFLSTAAFAQERAEIKGIPYLNERLHSSRWQVRYTLAVELTGRDAETKRALETLVTDENDGVAHQAMARYLSFVHIDKKLFKPERYLATRFALKLPAENPERALVDYCLARGKLPNENMEGPRLPVLEIANRENPTLVDSLNIVGIFGRAEDAKALYPFLESANAYVALNAAKACIRLGDNEKAFAALTKLTKSDPSTNLYYITQALYVMKEVRHPGFDEGVKNTLAALATKPDIQPNWVSEFIAMAAEGRPEVWK